MSMTYLVYLALDGCDLEYCGECETLAAAKEYAATSPAGLPRSLWDTARAAGHCAGLHAPTRESGEPVAWVGDYAICPAE